MLQYFTMHELFLDLIFPSCITVLSIILTFLFNLILEKYKSAKPKKELHQNKFKKLKEKFVKLTQKFKGVNKKT